MLFYWYELGVIVTFSLLSFLGLTYFSIELFRILLSCYVLCSAIFFVMFFFCNCFADNMCLYGYTLCIICTLSLYIVVFFVYFTCFKLLYCILCHFILYWCNKLMYGIRYILHLYCYILVFCCTFIFI